jgi:hypothetical protein
LTHRLQHQQATIRVAADHRADNIQAIAASDDGEPVPMSLDRDASDRTFDLQLAYLGLRDDAAPLFRENLSVPGVGALLALPCVIESGLFLISRKLYGEIGPAVYRLPPLRIKRPEHLRERDPAAFGRLLGFDRAFEVKSRLGAEIGCVVEVASTV